MAAVILLLVVSLLGSVEGSDLRYVAPGSDLRLDVNQFAVGANDDLIWKFNITLNIVRFESSSNPKFYKTYKDRAEFFAQNYSLLLRNVQHSDSGDYKAVASGEEYITVAEYTVRVQDRVSAVKLTVTPNDPSFCNFTATCRTVDSLISGTFHCVNQTCHLLKQTDLKNSSMLVYVDEGSIICNHSNHVSWEQDAEAVEFLCEKKTGKRKRRSNTGHGISEDKPNHNLYESPTDAAITSTYAMVHFGNPDEQRNDTSTNQPTQPETIYAQVNRATKSNSQPAAANG
ncbi:uncharacterized protein LOC124869860 isoform X1 [Girardinichthys multiradiatus]|uniref:uncharacterized protein LOC124869860 isoform X1 n=1 Tax=Girardinichthys multiradiatus TaxID=208333 RepID=UPI001FACF36B|nr:uncharacterized protein LOC124869860 isoform X1 [Girardinichthys multiradiatus]